jgi:hypothetical protein
MKFKFFCQRLIGHKAIGVTLDHDELAIGLNLIFCMVGIAKIYPYQSLVKTEDLRKDI